MTKILTQIILLLGLHHVLFASPPNASEKCCLLLKSAHGNDSTAKPAKAFRNDMDLPDSTYLTTVLRRNNDSLTNCIRREKDSLVLMKKAAKNLRAAQLCEKIADNYFFLDQYKSSMSVLNQAFGFYKQAHSPGLQGVYTRLGAYYNDEGDYRKAIKYGLLAIKTGLALNDSSSTMCRVYSDIALTYNTIGDYKNAEKFARMGAAIAINKKYISSLYLLVSNIAFSLENTNRYSEAIILLNKTAKDYPSQNHTDRLYLASRYINIYLGLNRLDLARPYALAFSKMGKGPLDCICEYTHWFFTMAYYYNNAKEYKKLRAFIITSHPQNKLSAYQRLIIVQRKFKADSALGFYKEAMNERYIIGTLYDSLFRAKKNLEISRLNIQFETELKDQQIRLQKAELERSQAVRSMFYYIIGTLLLIIILFVSLYRMKNRKNTELNLQKKIIDHKNGQLQQLVREKEWLLKEIHHRVKNNLQIVISLLNSQNSIIKDGVAFDAIQNSQARVNSMAMIHQKLYKSSDMSTIDLFDYIADLISYFRSTYVVRQRIDFQLDLVPLIADVSVAVPIALILNEAITNSLKYAFADGRDGVINVSMGVDVSDNVELRISDNGVGLPPDFESELQSSLGMNLIRGLTEDIGGSYTINGKEGTAISIRFAKEKLTENLPLMEV